MGRLLLMWRLVTRDLRRRPGEAAVFMAAVTAATAALALGLMVDNAVTTAYMNTRAATAGPDMTAITTAADPGELAGRIAAAQGVGSLTGPIPAFSTVVGAHGDTARSSVEGRERAPSPVDRPLVTSGTWVRPGGAVVERGFAEVLGVGVGDRVTIAGRDYPVVGIAISAAAPVYPWSDQAQGPGPTDWGGRIWLTIADARTAAQDAEALVVHLVHLRLTDPDAAADWDTTLFVPYNTSGVWVNTRTWEGVLDTNLVMVKDAQPALAVGGSLLAVAACVTLAALTAIRAARDHRRAQRLKAVGAGPRTVAAVLLAQYLLLTAAAAGLGLAIGTLAAPALAHPSPGLLSTVGPPSAAVVVTVVGLALAVVLVSTLDPVLHAARTGTAAGLAETARLRTRRSRLTALTAYLPTPLLLGVRLMARRPGRAVLSAVGMAATGVMVSALLTFRSAWGTVELPPAMAAVNNRTAEVLLGVTVAVVALSALNTVILGWSGAVQARRALGISRTLGATPGQVVAALCTAHLLPAVPALVVGLPAGIVLYRAFSEFWVVPPRPWLFAAALAVLSAAAVLTALPAWRHARVPAGRALNAEAA
ncbi:FtsX-like permease family protein [Streptomonospora nanhaiensis]|uniref:FtsX-like permease family protein n=1 Tax=Streptomonospora nanhaiensis TaxID=1323731 RepID=UPI001C9900AA|nr:FtsX-like permease family protein [Streptomonospora nanhaiensis]MBX9391613.1 ABC transporter permease [Streptomonospora nanhaiensis]